MNHKFYLNSPTAEKSAIMVYITHKGERLRISTGLEIESKLWDNNKALPKHSSNVSSRIKNKINEISAAIDFVYSEMINMSSGLIFEGIKSRLKEISFGKIDKPIEIRDYFDEFMSKREESKKFTIATQKVFITMFNRIIDYANHKKIKNITFDLFTEDFPIGYKNYLNSKGLVDNTVGKHLKTLKIFLKYCFKAGYLKTEAWKEYKVDKLEGDEVYLNAEEINRIYNLDLTSEPLLDMAKNMFLIQCWTALRFSDIIKLKQANIDYNNKVITLMTQKVGNKIIIPIHKKLKPLLEKYINSSTARPTSNVMYNKRIKIIGRRAEINDEVERIRIRGGKQISEIMPKWKMMSSHTGRRTWITQSLTKGALPELTMKISGHTDRKTFQRYVRLTQNEAVASLKQIWDKED